MFKISLFILVLLPTLLFSQVDNIELPDIELVIEDQSSLRTDSTEEALLKDRNPQFQEVYLEELSSSVIQDTSYQLHQGQRVAHKYSTLQFGYGSYNNTQINFHSENTIKNLVYAIDYSGLFTDNIGLNKITYFNTQKFRNQLDSSFSYALTNTLIDISLSYDQKKQSFLTNTDFHQDYHYVPVSFAVSHWITDSSYIKVDTDIRVAMQILEDTVGHKKTESILTENDLSLSYHANFTEWNYFIIKSTYNMNSYDNKIEHTGKVSIASEFNIGKGFSTTIGATIIGSTTDQVFGWPELALGYSYYDRFLIKLAFSGDFDIFGAADIMNKEEFFANKALSEAKWNASLSLFAKPTAYFWIGSKISYNMYRNKNIYVFNSENQFYTFENTKNVDSLELQASLGSKIADIFEITAAYTYYYFNKDWLILAPHQFDIILGIGYKPIGFWLESTLSMLSERNLRTDLSTPLMSLLNIKISQKVHRITTLSLELNNILNQNIQISQGSFYGGFQARGSVQLYF
ncbi:MAG: hypothetical protein ACRCTJ_06445 [Brevinema sp.]